MWFGDDIALKAEAYEAEMESLRSFLLLMRRLGAGESGLAARPPDRGVPGPRVEPAGRLPSTHAALQAEFAQRIGLPPPVAEALRQSYERWDGKGIPDGVKGERIALPSRIVALADLVEVHHRIGGPEAAREVARGLGRGDRGRAGAAPAVGGAELDAALEAVADLVDMKSPHTAGHSRGVARLVAELRPQGQAGPGGRKRLTAYAVPG